MGSSPLAFSSTAAVWILATVSEDGQVWFWLWFWWSKQFVWRRFVEWTVRDDGLRGLVIDDDFQGEEMCGLLLSWGMCVGGGDWKHLGLSICFCFGLLSSTVPALLLLFLMIMYSWKWQSVFIRCLHTCSFSVRFIFWLDSVKGILFCTLTSNLGNVFNNKQMWLILVVVI